jgi:hypothetical protein
MWLHLQSIEVVLTAYWALWLAMTPLCVWPLKILVEQA